MNATPAMSAMRMLIAITLLGITHAAVILVTKAMDSYVKVDPIIMILVINCCSIHADVNECQTNHECHENAECNNTAGNYTCSCYSGYQGNGFMCEGRTLTTLPNACKSVSQD